MILAPYDISQLRLYLYALFAPLLGPGVAANPHAHLATLAMMGPSLPPPLRPTQFQLETPHSVYIDMLPSPSLRERLIIAGPNIATTFLAQACPVVHEVRDQNLLSIWGDSGLDEMAWEFSPAVLDQWPMILTPEWGRRANFWRRQRGVPAMPAYEI